MCSNLKQTGWHIFTEDLPKAPQTAHPPCQPCPKASDCLTLVTRHRAAQFWTPHNARMQHAPFVSGSSHSVLCLGHSSNTRGRRSAMCSHCRGHTFQFGFLKGQVQSCPFSPRSVSLRADLRPQGSSSQYFCPATCPCPVAALRFKASPRPQVASTLG